MVNSIPNSVEGGEDGYLLPANEREEAIPKRGLSLIRNKNIMSVEPWNPSNYNMDGGTSGDRDPASLDGIEHFTEHANSAPAPARAPAPAPKPATTAPPKKKKKKPCKRVNSTVKTMWFAFVVFYLIIMTPFGITQIDTNYLIYGLIFASYVFYGVAGYFFAREPYGGGIGMWGIFIAITFFSLTVGLIGKGEIGEKGTIWPAGILAIASILIIVGITRAKASCFGDSIRKENQKKKEKKKMKSLQLASWFSLTGLVTSAVIVYSVYKNRDILEPDFLDKLFASLTEATTPATVTYSEKNVQNMMNTTGKVANGLMKGTVNQVKNVLNKTTTAPNQV